MPQLYRLQNRHSTYHILRQKDSKISEENSITTKVIQFISYYSVIVLFTLGASAVLDSFGISFALGAALNASWERPASVLLMESFLLLMFSTIRAISLTNFKFFQNPNQFKNFSNQLNGYLFSFLLTSYFLFMYQIGRVVVNGDIQNAVISGARIQEMFFIFTFSLFMTIPIVVFTEYMLKIATVPDHMKIM